ncbi:hypothetical protein [Aeromonas veronii]
MKKQLGEYLHVLAIIFPLTLLIPRWMAPLLARWQLAPPHHSQCCSSTV